MDKARIAAIWTELKEYGAETQLGFPLSTIKVGELAELISEHAGFADTIERLQKDLGLARKQRSEFAQSGLRLEAERDAALAEVESLKKQVGGLQYHLDAARAQLKNLRPLKTLESGFFESRSK